MNEPQESYMVVPGMDTDNFEVIKEHKVHKKDFFQLQLDTIKRDDILIKEDDMYVGIANALEMVVGFPRLLDPILDGIVVYKDCSNVDLLPDITFTLEGVDYTLTGHDYVIKSRGTCSNGMIMFNPYQPYAPVPENTLILGNIFLKKFFPMFDMNKDTVSF